MPLYNNFKEQLLLGAHNLDTATLKVTLHAGYTPDIDAHDYFDDVSGTEESGTGYTAGGITVANTVVAQDNTNDRASLDGDNVTWTGLNVGTPSHAILRVDTGTATTSTLIGYWAVTTPSNGGDYTLAFDSTGIVLLT
jgi:hypothetical protein